MRPARRIKHAEGIDRELHKHLSSSPLSELLQRTPPAALTAQQDVRLLHCGSLLEQMAAAFETADEAAVDLRLLEALLQQQAMRSAGTLIAWVQQRPEQLLAVKSVLGIPGDGASGCWAAGVQFLDRAAAKAGDLDHTSAAACQMSANMVQQLDQSGERCSLNCSMLVLRFERA
jgi:hypothetical protein